MSLWVVYAIGFSQIIVLHWLALPFSVRMTYDMYINRNPQWLSDHPAFRQRYPAPRYTVWLSYLFCIGWLALFAHQLADSSAEPQDVPLAVIPQPLFRLLVAPVISFVLLYLGHFAIEHFRIGKRIPLPAKRSTALVRRSLKDIVGLRWIYGGYLLLATTAVVAGIAYYAGRISSDVFTKGIGAVAGNALLLTLAFSYSILRKHQPLDASFGPSYRKSELIFWIFILYLLAAHGILVLLDNLFGLHLLSPVRVMVAVSVVVQGGMFYMGRHPWLRWLFPKNPPTPGAAHGLTRQH